MSKMSNECSYCGGAGDLHQNPDIPCPDCKGTGISKRTPRLRPKCKPRPKCICMLEEKQPVADCPVHKHWYKNEWEKEFEFDASDFVWENFTQIHKIIWFYLKLKNPKNNNYKIKCKDGCIQIERVK